MLESAIRKNTNRKIQIGKTHWNKCKSGNANRKIQLRKYKSENYKSENTIRKIQVGKVVIGKVQI